MFENWQKLVSMLKIFVLFLRESKLHDVKQNEKYPYAQLEHISSAYSFGTHRFSLSVDSCINYA